MRPEDENIETKNLEPCERAWGERISAGIDGELSPEDASALEKHLSACPSCREFKEALERMKGATMQMKFAKLPDEAWRHYWTGIYNRLERGIGWLILSLGIVILSCYGLYRVFIDFFADSDISIWVRFGVGFVMVGGVVLLVSIVREKIFRGKHERYKEVDL
ncbi:MAG TPA: hypothetical protein ENN07_06295 [candidate division Zixibacteria bacterium]|nr:hypothetical protein [candidate division Zixibacteria bacterium]